MFKRRAANRIMEALKSAYADLDRVPYDDDPDRAAQALGRYDGLKMAYIILTGRDAVDVAHDVTSWYIRTPEYREAKAHYS